MNYLVTIGLETHVQLNTKTKIFCSCALEFGAEPNSRVCPVCLGLPGVLPVLNHEVFLLGLRAVIAFGGTPSKRIKFDRKNYFYPDLPKGYQISQFDAPLGVGGFVEVELEEQIKKIRLNRIHMEEDAGKLIHDRSDEYSHVDLNRAGTPLIEMVTEPDLETPEEAYQYLTNLKAILKTIGVSECDMEKGHLRCDANVSIRKSEKDPYGKRVEIKNLNSFKAVKSALIYEIERQAEAVKNGETIAQETRLWDDAKQKTFTMRSKEEAHDYRYFPEPDLVPFFVTERELEEQKKLIPELPKDKCDRFMKQYQLSVYDARLVTQDIAIARFFEQCAKSFSGYKTISNWIIGPVLTYLNQSGKEFDAISLEPGRLLELAKLVEDGKVSFQAAKDKVFPALVEKGGSPAKIVEALGLIQVSDDSQIEEWVQMAITDNPKVVTDFKSGKESSAMFLVGQVMRQSGGKANPNKVQEILKKKLQKIA